MAEPLDLVSPVSPLPPPTEPGEPVTRPGPPEDAGLQVVASAPLELTAPAESEAGEGPGAVSYAARMKHDLLHLPKEKQEQVQAIAGLIRKAAPADLIVLFGSHARGDWVEDAVTGYRSDYDILVIVQSNAVAERDEVWSTVENRAEALPGMATEISIIAHDIKCVNKKLSKGQFFFCEIIKEGVLLHDSERLVLSAPREPAELSGRERREQAQRDFQKWFESAGDFLLAYELMLERGRHNIAAFNLHQATERYLATVLLVFSAYKPRIHNIETLYKQVCSQHAGFRVAFPRTTPEERTRFKLLKKAYIDSRYNEHYRITTEELTWLGQRVRVLRDLTGPLCQEKIDNLAQAAGG